MESLSIKCDATLFDKVGECSLSKKEIEVFTGLTWDQLNDLKDKMISLRNHSVIQALVLFLFKLRTGNSNKVIISGFKLDNEQSISDYCASVIKSFKTDILPFDFGSSALNRDDLINNHTTEIHGEKRRVEVRGSKFRVRPTL